MHSDQSSLKKEEKTIIIINDDYEMEKDNYQWILYKIKEGVHKDTGEPTKSRKASYHGNLTQVADYILDANCGECETLEEIRDLLVHANKTVVTKITKALQE